MNLINDKYATCSEFVFIAVFEDRFGENLLVRNKCQKMSKSPFCASLFCLYTQVLHCKRLIKKIVKNMHPSRSLLDLKTGRNQL